MQSVLLLAVVAFAFSYLVTSRLTPIAATLARRFGILDRPDEDIEGRKDHPMPTPYLGGVAIFTGLAVAAIVLGAMSAARPALTSGKFLQGILIAFAIGLVGLVDDIRPLPRVVRLAAQLGAAVGAWAAGFQIQAAPWEGANFALTLLWIVGISNAFNLLDNMDGLSAGLAGVAAAGFALIGALEGIVVLPIVSAALGGAAFGFLKHNRHPATIFMGDAGSLFLGFLLALIGIELRFDNLVRVTFLVPVIVLGLAIFDTALVVFSRLRNGRPVFSGARDHVSHRLIKLGLPLKGAVWLLYWTGICLVWLGLAISRSNVEVAALLGGFVLAMGVFFGVILFRVEVYSSVPKSRAEAELLDQLPPPVEGEADPSRRAQA